MKRGKFIGKVNSLFQEFHFVKSDIFIKMLNIYVTSFYGSGLWDLYSKEVDRLFKAWNVTIRKVLGVPNTTHRFLIEPLSGSMHPKVMLSSRLVMFRDTMMKNNKLVIKFLINLFKGDWRTVIGRNLGLIQRELGGDMITPELVKRHLKYFEVPAEEKWRVTTITELLEVKSGLRTVEGFTLTEVDHLIGLLCTE